MSGKHEVVLVCGAFEARQRELAALERRRDYLVGPIVEPETKRNEPNPLTGEFENRHMRRLRRAQFRGKL